MPADLRSDLLPMQAGVQRTFAALLGELRRRAIFAGGARWILAAAALALASYSLDRWLRPALPTRIGLAAGGVALLAWLAWRDLLGPWRWKLEPLDLAELLATHHPDLAERVARVLELPALLDRPREASATLIASVVAEDAQRISALPLDAWIDRRRTGWHAALLALGLAPAGLFALLAPDDLGLWWRRWALGSEQRWPQATYLAALGADAQGRIGVPRQEPFHLEVTAQPDFLREGDGWRVVGRAPELILPQAAVPASQTPEEVRLDPAGGAPFAAGPFTRVGEKLFRFELPPLSEPARITIRGGDDWLGPLELVPIDRPAIERLELRSRAAGSTAWETRRFAGGDSQLLFLPETELELRLTSRDPLAESRLTSRDGAPPEWRRESETEYAARWTHRQPLELELRLVSALGRLESRPHLLAIGLLHDRPPRVALRAAGIGRRVTPQAKIPLALRAVDDFGLAKLAVECERGTLSAGAAEDATTTTPLAFDIGAESPHPTLEAEQNATLDLATLNAAPAQLLKLRGIAWDRCAQGSQAGFSQPLVLHVVAPQELFQELLLRQRAQRQRFVAAQEIARQQGEALLQSLDPAQAEPLARQQQALVRQLGQIAEQFEQTLTEMELNALGAPEARQRLRERVAQPLRQLQQGPAQRLADLLSRFDPQAADAPAQQALARQWNDESLAAMQELLKQMSQWESLIDVANQVQELIRLQSRLLDETEKSRKQAINDLFDE